jgi:hypothetical protein
MQTPALLITVVLYTITAAGFYNQGKPGLAIAFICYSIANLGFIWEGLK